MRVYLCGPMRGLPELNFPAFHSYAKKLRGLGYDVFNPAESDESNGYSSDRQRPLAECAPEDTKQVLSSDIVACLPGWVNSRMGRVEVLTALAADNPIQIIDAETMEPIPDPAMRVFEALSSKSEVRITDPKTGGQKGQKLERYDLIPVEPLEEIARVYGRGSRKYSDRNWEKGYAWSLSFAAMMRHAWAFWRGEERDELGNHHMACVCFHAMALTFFGKFRKELDDRPVKS